MRAVGVIQVGPDADSSAAIASVVGTPTYLFHDAGWTGDGPDGVEVLPAATDDRVATARALRAICSTGRIVVLRAHESLSADLVRELRERDDGVAPVCAYRAPAQVFLLGRCFETSPIVLAWDGDPGAVGPVVECRGVVVVRFRNLQHAIAALDARARRMASRGGTVSAGDFLWRPVGGLVRRTWRRRRDGVAGLILSVLETYGQVLAAAKIWEQEGAERLRATVPPSFHRRERPGGVVAVRDDVGPELERILVTATPEHVAGGRLLAAGRGATWAVRIAGAIPAMVRWYLRGGVPSRITRDTFVAGGVPRPLQELAVTEQARARGIPVPEVLGVRVDQAGVGRYRGAIVTREIEGGVPLGTLLESATPATRHALVRTTAQLVRLMHDRGLHHPDLNAGNVLLVRRDDGFDAFVIDLDRARVGGPVAPSTRRRALRRLERSLARFDGEDAETRALLYATYGEIR